MLHRLIRLTIRMLLMIPALLSLLWSIFPSAGLVMSVIGAWVGILLAELSVLQRLRTRSVVVLAIVLVLLPLFFVKVLVHTTLFSVLLGPTNVLLLRSVIVGGMLCCVLSLAFRLLGKRSGVWFAVELGLLALSSVVLFFPHQYKIVMRPLWLGDLAWSLGLEPSVALGLIGVILASILGILTIFERSRRLHLSVLLMPLLALSALIFVDPLQMDTPEPPKYLEQIRDGWRKASPTAGGGGGFENQGEQNLNSGAQEKSESSNGTVQPIAIMLLQNDYNPPSQMYYLRQEIQSTFNGIRMVMPKGNQVAYEALRGFPMEETLLNEAIPTDFRKSVISDIALLQPHGTPIALEGMIRYTPTVNPRPGRFDRTYETESWVTDVHLEELLWFTIGSPQWTDEEWAYHTEAPDDPRYKELADSIVEQLPDEYADNPIAKAFAIKLFLDQNTKYTMKESHDSAEDPTAEFLFGPYKQFIGYCVHTSHAAALLWRSIGIPARISVGYASSAEQRRGSAVMILNTDAHSWPELYIEELGWIVLDISPAVMLDEAAEPPDLELLESLAELARAEPDSKFRQAIDWSAIWATLRPWLAITGGGLGGLLLLVLYTRKIRRRYSYRWDPSPQSVYISALDHLSENGVRRGFGESREGFAARVQDRFPAFQQVTWAQIQFALDKDPNIEIDPLVIARGQLTKEIHSEVPWWRRTIGVLNPISPHWSL